MQARFARAAILISIAVASCAGNQKALAPEPSKTVTVSIFPGPPEGKGAYAGGSGCRACHEEVFRRWSGTGHAGSYRTLAISREEGNPACLRCHTTGFGDAEGFLDAENTPDLASVSCEACHGPSEDHARSAFPRIVTTPNGGECSSCEVSRICRSCHTRRHSPDFVLSRALETVSCASAPGAGVAGAAGGE